MAVVEPTPMGKFSRKSVFWAAAETGGTMTVTMVTTLLMARMIAPDEFGTGAIAIGTVMFLNLFVESLFHDALVRNPDTDDETFATAFSLVLIISASIVAAGVVVAILLQHSATAWLFVGASLTLPFNGALGIGNARLRRDLIFKQVAQASLVGRLIGSLTGVGLAALNLGAWSLVSQFFCSVALQTFLLYVLSGWRPGLRASFGSLWPICRFALPYALMNSLVALRGQGFLMMIAGFMSLAAAGYVNVAFRITTTPQFVLIAAFTNLGLPLLSRHQYSRTGMERSFVTLTQLVVSITVPVFVGLALTAQEIVPILLGSAWVRVIPLVQLLALGVALHFLRLSASAVLRALGHVRYSLASSLFQLAFTFIGMFMLHPNDLRTAMLLWVLPAIVQLPVAFLVVHRVAAIRFRIILGGLLPVFVATAAMSVVVMEVAGILQTEAPMYRLIGEVTCGAATVILGLLVADGHARAVIYRRLAGLCVAR
jgi:O-antigen/teichoic acid export membrane protein